MSNLKNLPHLLNLLDDESSEVQEMISQHLLDFGPTLRSELLRLPQDMVENRAVQLDQILEKQKQNWLLAHWPAWFQLKEEHVKLEKALGLLAHYIYGLSLKQKKDLPEFLDELAEEFQKREGSSDVKALSRFLFQEKKFIGAEDDYYNPYHSNLIHVIQHKKGIPISLVCLFILIGRRCGFEVEGYPFPGHYMAKVNIEEESFLVDCYNQGRLVKEKDVVQMNSKAQLKENAQIPEPKAYHMVSRILSNLIHAYELRGELTQKHFIYDLYHQLSDRWTAAQRFRQQGLTAEGGERMFSPGQVVEHKQYGYIGLVVDSDEVCKASDDWYSKNLSQPDRNQPWYHILVHQTDHVTYSAESNLKAGPDKPIEHPLINYFFMTEEDGNFLRNDTPWPRDE